MHWNLNIIKQYFAKGSLVSFLFLLIILANQPVQAQIDDAGKILRSGTEDAEILLSEYLKPFGSGFGADLNTGWFSSARPLGNFGFDLQVSVSTSFVPLQDRSFDVTSLKLNTVKLLDGPSETPTIFGDDFNTSRLGSTEFNSSNQQEEEIYSFQMPEGSGYHIVPAPMAQFSLGLPGATQVTLRYSPKLEIANDYSIRVFGIGGLIGFNQLFFNDALPFDISVQAGMMNLSANSKVQVLPQDEDYIDNQFSESYWDGQAINLDTNTFVANFILGKTISSLSIYGGIGHQYASTEISTKGPYPIVVPQTNDNSNGTTHQIQSLSVPINITLEGVNTIHALGGLQLKLGFISISASYTFAEYSTLNASVGIVFRS